MKRLIFIFMTLGIPFLVHAQLDIDGKTGVSSTNTKLDGFRPHSILLSASTLTPFGIKYQYCRNFGGYISFKMDPNVLGNDDYLISAGVSKSISKRSNLWVGGGFDFGYDKYRTAYYLIEKSNGVGIEAGWLMKGINGFSVDIGVGCMFNYIREYEDNGDNWDEGVDARPCLILGIGYSF